MLCLKCVPGPSALRCGVPPQSAHWFWLGAGPSAGEWAPWGMWGQRRAYCNPTAHWTGDRFTQWLVGWGAGMSSWSDLVNRAEGEGGPWGEDTCWPPPIASDGRYLFASVPAICVCDISSRVCVHTYLKARLASQKLSNLLFPRAAAHECEVRAWKRGRLPTCLMPGSQVKRAWSH